MRTKLAPLSFVLSLAVTVPALAQQIDLPRLSPAAKVSQTAGLTEISIEYSSPAVRGRTIWGELVPYGEIWRAGANAATKVTFSKDVKIGATLVPAGSYALFVIPTQSNWTVILNKEANQVGAFGYKKELDQVRLDVKPEVIPLRERLAYLITDFTNAQATLALEWEKVRIAVPIQLDTDAQVATSIKAADENVWAPLNTAARYQLEQKKDYAAGLALVDKSMRIQQTWQNTWTKAQLVAAQGKYKDAHALAQKAQQLGEKSANFYYVDDVKKAVAEWQGKK